METKKETVIKAFKAAFPLTIPWGDLYYASLSSAAVILSFLL